MEIPQAPVTDQDGEALSATSQAEARLPEPQVYNISVCSYIEGTDGEHDDADRKDPPVRGRLTRLPVAPNLSATAESNRRLEDPSILHPLPEARGHGHVDNTNYSDSGARRDKSVHRNTPEESIIDVGQLASEVRRLTERQDSLLGLLNRSLKVQSSTNRIPEANLGGHLTPEELAWTDNVAQRYWASLLPSDENIFNTVELFLGNLTSGNQWLKKAPRAHTSASPKVEVVHESGTGDKTTYVFEWEPCVIESELESWYCPSSKERDADTEAVLAGVRQHWPTAISEEYHEWLSTNIGGSMCAVPPMMQQHDSPTWVDCCPVISTRELIETNHDFRRIQYTKAQGGLFVQQIALILHQISCHKPYAEDDIWSPNSDRGDFLQWIEVKDDIRDKVRPMVARKFILDFSRRWSAIRPREVAQDIGWGWIHISHHMRVLSLVQDGGLLDGLSTPMPYHPGLQRLVLDRFEEKIMQGPAHLGLFLESRFSIAVESTFMLRAPVFIIHVLTDRLRCPVLDMQLGKFGRDTKDDTSTLKEAGLRVGRQLRGIVYFQWTIIRVSDEASTTLHQALDMIDHLLQTLPEDIRSPRDMYDRALQTSEVCFRLIQLLQMMSDWVHQHSADIQRQSFIWNLKSGIEQLIFVDAADYKADDRIITDNWAVIVSHDRELADALLTRIERNINRVKGLRDSLFSATSVREAVRGTKMNQSIFVLTIMTIFYLPLTFVTTVFGMHLFDNADPRKNQISFYVSTGLISVVTWAAAYYAVQWYRPPEDREHSRWLDSIVHRFGGTFGRKLRSGEDARGLDFQLYPRTRHSLEDVETGNAKEV